MKFNGYLVCLIIVSSLLLGGAAAQASSTNNEAAIQQLLKRIIELQAQLRAIKGEVDIELERNLTIGDVGADVTQLQKFLNRDSATVVSLSGLGSLGQETDTFGSKTADAVRRFQEKYADEILVPGGLTHGTGFVGSATREKINKIQQSSKVTVPSKEVSVKEEDVQTVTTKEVETSQDTPVVIPKPKCTLAVSDKSLLIGDSAELSFVTENAVSALLNAGVGSVLNKDKVVVSPVKSTEYVLTVKNATGEQADCSINVDVVSDFSQVGLSSVTAQSCVFPMTPAAQKQTYYWLDKEYATINGESLRYDMSSPQKEGKYPLIMLVHGGGFQGKGGVTKTSKFPEADLRNLAAQGYVVVTVSYSQATSSVNSANGKNNFPEAIKDLRCAVKYFRSGTDPQLRFIDTNRIGVLGTSAGGHMALLLGTSANETAFDDPECPYNNLSAQVQSVAAFYPSTRFRPESARYNWTDYKNVSTDSDPYIIFGQQSSAVVDLIRKGSPLYAIENYSTNNRSNIPPILVVNAGNERNLSLVTSVNYMVDSLRNNNLPHILFTESSATHGFDPLNTYKNSSCYVRSFFENTLK